MTAATAGDILLIYPLGNSDLKINGESVQKEHFRDIVGGWTDLAQWPKVAVELLPAPAGDLAEGVRLTGKGQTATFQFPILRDLLAYLVPRHAGARWRFRFIATQQGNGDAGKQDTYGLPPLLRRYLQALAAAGHVRDPDIEQWTIKVNPADYDAMTEEFTSIARAYQELIAEVAHAYYSIAPGTSAMAFASAVTLGHETRLQFLYKPHWKNEPAPVESFLRLPRQRSLALLDRTLAALEFEIGAEILAQPGSGFRPDEATVAAAIGPLTVLPLWQRELFPEAAAVAADLPASAGTLVRALCEAFTVEPSPTEPYRTLRFWRLRLIDGAIRLRVALVRDDLAAFVDGVTHFIDMALVFGLTWDNPGIDWRNPARHQPPEFWPVAQQKGWEADPDRFPRSRRFDYLAVRFGSSIAEDRAAKQEWLNALRRLNRLVDQRLREYRIEHQHGAAAFERTLVDEFVRAASSEMVAAGDGGWAVLQFVQDVLDSIPGDPLPDDYETEAEATIPLTDRFFRECLSLPRQMAEEYGIAIPGASDELLHRIVPPPRPKAYHALR